jgi:hypothetical protein
MVSSFRGSAISSHLPYSGRPNPSKNSHETSPQPASALESSAWRGNLFLRWGEVMRESGDAQHLQSFAHHRNDLRRSLLDHGVGEAQHTPAVKDQEILTPTIGLEDLRVVVVKPAIDFDGSLDVTEGDVDEEQRATDQ